MYNDSLLIVCDTPDLKRVDGVDVSKFKDTIKIDHHPYIETFCNLEWIDDTASSASQMIIELTYHTRLKMTKCAAEKLYIGLVADTERFLHSYTTAKTFELVAKLIKDTKLDFTKLYPNLYLRSIKDLKFQGYIMNNKALHLIQLLKKVDINKLETLEITDEDIFKEIDKFIYEYYTSFTGIYLKKKDKMI